MLRFKLYLVFLFSLSCANVFSQNWGLEKCISYALENNLNVIQADLNNKFSETQITRAKNQKLPDLTAGFNNQLLLGRSNVPITNSSQIVGLNSSNFQRYSLDANIGSRVTVYQGGFLKLNEKKAVLDYQSDVFGTEDLKNDIALNVVNAYLNILLNKEIQKISLEQQKISENQLDFNQKLYNGGAIALSRLYEAQAQLANDKQNFQNAKIGVEQARFNLAQLLQIDDYEGFDVTDVPLPEEVELGLYDLDAIVEYAYANQPNTKQAVKALESAELDIDIAKTAYKPTVSGSYGIGSNYNDFLNRSDDDNFIRQINENLIQSVNLNISIPIFNRFITDLNVEQARIGVEIQQNNFDIQKQSLRQDVQQAFFNVQTNYQQYIAAKESVRSAQLAFDFAKKSLKAGQITVYDFNQSANTLFAAKGQMLQAKYNFLFRTKVLDFYAGKPLGL